MTTARKKGAEEHSFQAEVTQVLDIVINSLYSHRQIFLRELISNAADALDKIRFKSAQDPELLGDDKDLQIEITPLTDEGILVIRDHGIGMTKDELIQNLGTIAHSGSRRFIEGLKEAGEDASGVDLIGRFGVGFYSAFIVADEVEVHSRAAGEDVAHAWSSDAKGSFSIAEAQDFEGRGTAIRLHLKDDAKEFLAEHGLRSLVTRFSDFVSFPIKLLVEKTEGEGDDAVTTQEFEVINQGGALWKRQKKDISEEDLDEFYRHVTHDWEGPAQSVHFNIEGALSYTGLLFIPSHPPFDLFDRDQSQGVRLYVKRVFIMEDCKDFLPEYLRFIRGIIDSDDLPLNVSRELLQEDRITRSIRKTVVSKVLGTIVKMAEKSPEDYAKFWENFGKVLKEGLHFDQENKDKIAKLVRYATSREELSSLDEYVDRMPNPEGDEPIYYAFGQSRKAVEGSPHIEGLVAEGHEVIYMTDPIDEWAVEGLREFRGHKLVSAMRSELPEDDKDEEKKDDEEEDAKSETLSSLRAKATEVLSEQVSEVRVSKRLRESPVCLVTPDGAAHAHIERMLRAQNQEMPATKRIMEINPNHPVIQKLEAMESAGGSEEKVADWLHLLHDQALLAEGSPVDDPQSFAQRLASLMSGAI